MTNSHHLSNAPIKEALIDLRVALPQNIGLGELEAAHDRIRDRFPVKKTIHEGRFGVRIDFDSGENPETTAGHNKLGFRFETDDGVEVAQFKTNGFTYSRLAPYTNWEDIRSSANALWQQYLEVATPDRVTRIATRFINVIHIPLPFRDFEEYLTEPPRIPEKLPQALSSYLMRIVLPEPSIGATAIITQALEQQEREHVPIVLDIDVFISHTFDADDAAIWDRLEDLRRFKNDVFFGSVTEKTEELCQ